LTKGNRINKNKVLHRLGVGPPYKIGDPALIVKI